jgi:protein-S-isoprenylcysteine O-methyltransferase Ste14
MAKYIKSIIIVLLVPGTFFVYLPVLLGLWVLPNPDPILALHPFAILAWLLGAGLAAWGMAAFALQGQGTPAPNAPPRQLVAAGPYHYSRNPMYVASWVIVLGHLLWFQSWPLAAYLLLVTLFFYFGVRYFEEPRLRSRFGEPYAQYCRTTPRWLF